MRQTRFAVLISLLAWPAVVQAQLVLNPNPSRMIGQVRLEFSGDQMNLVEGRELNNPRSVAIDASFSPAALYVADTGNNRVLAWRDAATFASGAPADLVIGQRDLISTIQQGPGTSLTSGLRAPTGVAVDRVGRLFVLDSGNNRILRFPRPFTQPDDLRFPDLVLGQDSMGANAPNQGGPVSAKTLSMATSGSVYTGTLAFDAQGNLWVTDAGNHRVLRYAAARVGDSAANGPPADVVLGQTDFTSNTPLATSPAENRLAKGRMREPSGLAFDRAGRLFVVDGFSRILVFAPNPVSGADALRVMGVVVAVQGQPAPLAVNDTGLLDPQGILVINNTPLVLDSLNHRILRYDPVDLWPAETPTVISPAARAVIGQDSIVSNAAARANRGKSEPGNNTLSYPVQAAYYNGETFVVDPGNNRVLVFPDLSSGPAATLGSPYEAKRVLGQTGFEFRGANLIDGRGMNRPQSIAVDTTSNPPRLYIADTYNHRVLGFKDVRKLRPGDAADLVIGQPDFGRAVPNYPTNEANQPSASSLLLPAAVAVDPEGNLWVADTGNGRVLRFPRPFDGQKPLPLAELPRADLVVGQSSFTVRNPDATARTLAGPAGVAFSPDGHLFVSDAAQSRVLFYRKPFSTGMAAVTVIGQPDFLSAAAGTESNRFNGPRNISVDTDGRLYVADFGNNRVSIFSNPNVGASDPSPAFTLAPLSKPQGMTVSALTGEIWVAEGGANRVQRFPRFDLLLTGGARSDAAILLPGGFGAAAISLDPFGNLLIADSGSRISIHFPALVATNAANNLPRIAPGMYATLRPVQFASFGEETKVFNEVAFPPMARSLGDVQVLVNDEPVPLHYVSPTQINVFVPMTAPSSGTAEFQVVRVSTGQILASYPVRMDVASPGLFTANGSGTGPLAALNEDNTLNTPANPIARGQVIQLFGTGQGLITNGPPDGQPSSGLVPTAWLPRIIIGTDFVADSDILYSGYAPGAVGLWQINVKIPDKVLPGAGVIVVVVQRDIPSNNPQVPAQIRTTIGVKQ
ncbi:MAG: hypothetical protein HY822_05940 [Acidobacteria bacterium]|nr:hypothetical protein [Acidobacteriota bacterium]